MKKKASYDVIWSDCDTIKANTKCLTGSVVGEKNAIDSVNIIQSAYVSTAN